MYASRILFSSTVFLHGAKEALRPPLRFLSAGTWSNLVQVKWIKTWLSDRFPPASRNFKPFCEQFGNNSLHHVCNTLPRSFLNFCCSIIGIGIGMLIYLLLTLVVVAAADIFATCGTPACSCFYYQIFISN